MDATTRKPYRTDLTDAQWELLQITIPAAKPGGRPRSTDMREVINTLLYLNRTGCQWDLLPHDLLPKSTVYEYFAAWRDDGTWQLMLDVLREGYREVHAARPGSAWVVSMRASRSVETPAVVVSVDAAAFRAGAGAGDCPVTSVPAVAVATTRIIAANRRVDMECVSLACQARPQGRALRW